MAGSGNKKARSGTRAGLSTLMILDGLSDFDFRRASSNCPVSLHRCYCCHARRYRPPSYDLAARE
jgi:hypothetical protein